MEIILMFLTRGLLAERRANILFRGMTSLIRVLLTLLKAVALKRHHCFYSLKTEKESLNLIR